ncbi:unnamed protein product [Orchesella dallaii]|uniref:Huntingtin-interacting protein 1 n=1 Tax=Orchesella dallaii TaxID=48710 RepID=A0ABP1QZK3_9HEXA
MGEIIQYPYYYRREDFPPVSMATCLSKAINNQESPVKEKHVRSAIIGTYQERGASTFWDCVFRLPLKENPVVCWKFCFVLHKVLREGHVNVLKDSQRYRLMLQEHGRFWGHLKPGYGTLVKLYCDLLNIKLNFHIRNQRIPGNLELTDDDLIQCTGDNEDAFFQLSVEMFDYLDAIVELQHEIYKTMETSRSNSMMYSGQCRLTPLIPCIQDSMLLYDYTTKILFRLHAKLSPDLLEGHRQRFLKVFAGLKQFYEKTMSLQYFKNLIEIQLLPKNPPNFLLQADLENYETRKVTIYNSMDDTQSEAHSDSFSDLVDLQESNGSNSPDPAAMAREKRIKELEEEIERLKQQLERIREEAKVRIHQLRFEIQELTAQLAEKSALIGERDKKIAELLKHECKIPNDFALRVDTAEKNAKVNEEKFGKMKGLYTNLREEHIDLLRKKGACDKELTELRKVVDGQTEMGALVEDLRKEKEELESTLHKQLRVKEAECEEMQTTLVELKSQIETVEATKSDLEKGLTAEMENLKEEMKGLLSLKSKLENSKQELGTQLEDVTKKFHEISKELLNARTANESYEAQIGGLQSQMNENMRNMESESIRRYNELLNACIEQSQFIIRKNIEDLEHPLLTGGSGALDTFVMSCHETEKFIQDLESATGKGYESFGGLKSVLEQVPLFTNHVCNLLIHGGATSQTSADIQKGDEMLSDCRNLGGSVLTLYSSIKQRLSDNSLNSSYGEVRDKLSALLATARGLGTTFSGKTDAADVLEKELQAMEQAIDEASKRMEEILSNSRASHTGVKLEVNEKLIDSCTTLMNAIRLLVQRAKHLQREIVGQGKGSASVKEFYKRNHQWTEGLISAAKSVGSGAKFLLECADKTMTNPGGGFELLIASSQDIAASTIQLVVASQVRADRSSENLALLKNASTGVKTATANVVATAKDCAQLIEESDEMDVTKLSTHNAKRLELETQAEVLRLQSELEKARMKLAALRQHHYHNSDS